jgi:hypothetical protein
MTQGKYIELSVAQRTDLWRRWKAGSRGIRLGAPLRQAAYVHSPAVGARRWNCSGGSQDRAASKSTPAKNFELSDSCG